MNVANPIVKLKKSLDKMKDFSGSFKMFEIVFNVYSYS
jgi:hypothetical protein